MKIFLIAGEASGDLHASNLMKHLKLLQPNISFRFFGGDKMKDIEPNGLLVHYKQTAFMGIVDVVKNLDKVSYFLKFAKKQIIDFQPDIIILIDYPGFNLEILKFAKSLGFRVFYFIPPKIWAWNKKRLKTLRLADKIFVIFPFEVQFYKQHNIEVEYFGNPLIDIVAQFKKDVDFLKKYNLKKPLVALLPGSRKQEIVKILPYYQILAKKYSDFQFVIAGISALKNLYSINEQKNLKIIFDQTYNILSHSQYAIVTSGTATLETALFGVPQIVTYLPGWILYWLGKLFIKIPYISLVNIIMQQKVVEEIIHQNFKTRLLFEFEKLITNQNYSKQMIEKYKILKEKLGSYPITEKIAKRMLELIH